MLKMGKYSWMSRPWPEGVEVNIAVVEPQTPEATVWDKLLALAGTVEGPVDWAQNHDHYIHGTPKRT